MKFLIVLAKFLFLILALGQVSLGAARKPCSGSEFSEALLFLSDYENCIFGNELSCRSISDFVWTLRTTSFSTATGLGGHYIGNKISKINPKYVTKQILEQNYLDSTIILVGGKEVDDLIKSNGNDIHRAQADVEKTLDEFKKIKNPSPQMQERISNLETLSSQIKNRQKLAKANYDLLESVTSRIHTANQNLIEQITKIDQEIEQSQQKLNLASRRQSAQLKDKLASLKKLKSYLFDKVANLETDTQEIAVAYNRSIDQITSHLQKEPQSQTTKETIEQLKRKKFKTLPKKHLEPFSRLVQVHGESSLALVDISNPDRSRLPKMALRMKEAQAEFVPQRIRYWMRKEPSLGVDTLELIEKVAIDEHERYREFTTDLLSEVADEWKKIDAVGQINLNLTEGIDAEMSRLSSPLKIEPLKKQYAHNPEGLRDVLAKEKKNWIEVDVPYDKLSKENKFYTTSSIETTLKYIDNKFVAGEAIRPARRILYRTYPIVGRALQQVAKDGIGKGVAGLAIWYDWHDLSELGLKLAFKSDWIRNKLQDSINPQCRMPLETKLNGKDSRGQVTRYFCNCKEDLVTVNQPICQFLPAEKDGNERLKTIDAYCAVARQSGRDRDLNMAIHLRQLKSENLNENDKKNIIEMFKANGSCKMMTNQPANCRIPSEEITEQGFYFLTLIRKNQLESEVAELCPNVCEHWVDLAKAKLKIKSEIETVQKLPKSIQENKAEVSCEREKIISNPPQEKNRVVPSEEFIEKLNQWQKCQTPIVCQKNKIRINIDRNRRYEIQLDEKKKSPKIVAHHFLSGFGIHPDIRSHEFEMGSDGTLEKLRLFDLEPPNELSEELEAAALPGFFGDKAFETKPDMDFGLGPKRSEFPMAKRLEMFLATFKAIEFCCSSQQMDCEGLDRDQFYQNEINQGSR